MENFGEGTVDDQYRGEIFFLFLRLIYDYLRLFGVLYIKTFMGIIFFKYFTCVLPKEGVSLPSASSILDLCLQLHLRKN